ncbi:MAG: indole-3-glycerol phosphate synthase TrpC [Eubacteriales bacterium]
MILDKIINYKIKQLQEEKSRIPLDMIQENMVEKPIRDFAKALSKSNHLSIIAEIKKASPSKGIIKEDFNPLNIALEYQNSLVDGISVLTEKQFFLGENQHLISAKEATTIPILRKDFVIDPYQIVEARAIGADAILLITAILGQHQLREYIALTNQLGMRALVEVHDVEELQIALQCGAQIIGINNRDLKTFHTDLHTTEELIQHIPKGKIIVSESGISTKEDMRYLGNLGIHAVLIGESLMQALSIAEKVKELRSY